LPNFGLKVADVGPLHNGFTILELSYLCYFEAA